VIHSSSDPNGGDPSLFDSNDSILGSKGIFAEGKCNFNLGNFYTQNIGLQAVHASVAGVVLRFNDLTLYNYDQDAANVDAIDMANGSIAYIDGNRAFGSSGGTGGYYAATGTIYVDDWRDWTPAPVAGTPG